MELIVDTKYQAYILRQRADFRTRREDAYEYSERILSNILRAYS